ncbi:hypothetical protein AHAS_Ahas14G0190300 [Arachis hypogaea]
MAYEIVHVFHHGGWFERDEDGVLNYMNDLYPNDNHQDHLQNDDTDFKFIAFQKVADGIFFDCYNQVLARTSPECGSGSNGNGDCIRLSMEELLIDKDVENRWSSRDPPTSSLSSSKVDDDLDGIPLRNVLCVDSKSGSGLTK